MTPEESSIFYREAVGVAVQALIAIEMQLDVLRRQSSAQTNPLDSELARIQGLIREEVLKIQELMRSLHLSDIDSSNLIKFLTELVERFGRETGIAAQFVSELGELQMPQRICRELAGIIQEGLVNTRRMTGARHVQVRLTATASHWQVAIEDDGSSYRSNRMMVIRERAHAIEGEATVESNPGRGSCLVVTVPR